MGNPRNVIEINGKIYDATSGHLVSQPTIKSAATSKTVDGFTRPAPKTLHVTPDEPIKVALQPKATTHREASVHHKRRSPQKSQTLMRHAVKKPASSNPKPTQIISSHQGVSSPRADRAKATTRSAYINKFSTLSAHQPVVKRTAPLAVKEAPHHSTHAPTHKHHQTATPPTPTKSEALFSKVLEQAPAKQHAPKHQKKTKHGSSRAVKWGTGIAAVLLLVGFIIYMNLPSLNMQLASAQAGFGAAMPGYTPSGFKAGAISYKAGQVTVAFASNTDQRNYKVTQAVSSWNSQALQENFLNAKNATYQTAQTSGKTIYMYDSGNATWVNGGVWYQVESNQALSSDQLLKIASSL